MPKPKKLSDDEFKTLIEGKLRSAMGASGTTISKDRERNLEAYLAEPEGEWSPPEIEDRSSLVATDAADTVEWMLPSLLRIFASSKDAIDAIPRRPQFEQQAEVVRESLRWLFWEKLQGLTLLHTWFKDGLIQKVGFVSVDWCESEEVSKETYKGLTEAQVSTLLGDEHVEVLEATERTETTDMGPVQVYDITIERTEKDGYPDIKPVPPEEMRIDADARYGSEPKFIAQEYYVPRSQLLSEGYPVADMKGDDSVTTEESYLRRRIQSATAVSDDDDDPLLRVVKSYLRHGSETDARWEYGLIIGDEVMEREEVDGHPWVWWCPAPMPHVFFGNCPVDQALQPQRLRTRLLRAVEDNVYLTVNGRTGVVGGDKNTINDILDSRPGGIVRMKTKDDLVPIVQPDMSQAAWSAVEWAEQWTEKRTGFSRLSKGLSSDALNDTATGVMEITERADMRTELVARHAADSLTKLLNKVLRIWARHQDVSQSIRIAGRWVDIDPRQWETHYQVRINVGLGSGNKDRQTGQLLQLQAIQGQLAGAGMIPPPAAIEMARKITETMGFDEAEKYFPDPPLPDPNQPPPLPLLIEQMKGQQRQAEIQANLQAKQQELQSSLQLQASNDQRDAERTQMQAELNAQLQAREQDNRRVIAELQEANRRAIAEMQDQTKLQIAAMSAQQAAPEVDTSAIQRLEQGLQAIVGAMNAPKQAVRDQMGRVVGMVHQPVDTTGMDPAIAALVAQLTAPKQVVRDPMTGRVSGVVPAQQGNQ